ncbi:MAG: GNAT family N-acetyltransferase [Lentisphaerae bacterium]|nr:GNAT family N-acetyltransferase [Lentisphaerota bacterium]
MNSAEKLHQLFNPETVAVIGATDKVGSVGHALMRNLIGSGYPGIVYPINSKRKSVLGVKAYPTINDVPDRVDLAVVATPASTIPQVTEQCGQAGVGAMVIISAGFMEAGEEGQRLFAQALESARRYGMRILGPNCLGFIKPSIKLNASFANKMALPGKLAFISQSGALCTSILDWAVHNKVGFSHFVSIGSMGDIGFHDLIDYFGSDSETSSILIYMESLSNAKRFMSAARAFARTKPIIVLKVGRSSAGAKAAMSHTGSLTGDDSIFDAAFKRAGIIRVNTIWELFNCAQTLATQPRPRSNRLAIVTNAGGPGVIATDRLMQLGGQLATVSDSTLTSLNKVLPAAWSHNNPVDVLGDADPVRYKEAVDLCLKDEATDGVLVVLTPQAMTLPAEIAQEIVSLPKQPGKTLLASWMGADDVARGQEVLLNAGIPVFETPEQAVTCFMHMVQYSRNLELLHETPESTPSEFVPKTQANRDIIAKVVAEGRTSLTETEAKEFISNYDIPVGKHGVATSAKEAVAIAEQVGFPVVMKILSADILHKTDVGGVVVGVTTATAAEAAYTGILDRVKAKRPEARIQGILIEEMSRKKYELLIGCKKDPIFGPVIVFGMGGVAVEVFRDTNIALPPLNMALSRRLIEDTHVYTLLKGYRGMEGVELRSLQFLLNKFAYLIMDFPEIKEVDINPFGIDMKGGVVMDAKIILDEAVIKNPVEPYGHLVISPYPKDLERVVQLKTGLSVQLRPIRPEDEPLEAEMFRNFSPKTQRFRFFQLVKNVTHEMLVRYTQIDYDRELAIIAEVNDGGQRKMAGVVRIIADPYNETAEFAIVVADPWQNQGLGNIFTDYILELARKRGVNQVYATFLRDNHVMKHLFEKRKFTITGTEDSYKAELKLN